LGKYKLSALFGDPISISKEVSVIVS
jgi:hypothetical protein